MEDQKPISALRRRAQEIQTANANAAKKKQEQEDLSRQKREEELLAAFKEDFAELLPLLEEEGITYDAHVGQYENVDPKYITFYKGNHSVSMDYAGRGRYRYENPMDGQPRGIRFGNWLKSEHPYLGGEEGFILWITENLIDKYQPDPSPLDFVRMYNESYQHYFVVNSNEDFDDKRSLRNFLFELIIGARWERQVIALHPWGPLNSQLLIAVVRANDPVVWKTGVWFKEGMTYTECCDVLDEMNEAILSLSPEFAQSIVESSIGATPAAEDDDFAFESSGGILPKDDDPNQLALADYIAKLIDQSFAGWTVAEKKGYFTALTSINEFIKKGHGPLMVDPDEESNSAKSKEWMEKWRDIIYNAINVSKHSSALMLDDGEQDDVIVYCYNHFDFEVIDPHLFVKYIDEAADWVVALRNMSRAMKIKLRKAENLG